MSDMPIPIQGLTIRTHRLTPAEAEVWITVTPDESVKIPEVRGRLTGPRCAFASTVEVAYPFRPLPGCGPDASSLTVRVIVPEPSWWDPQSPFWYDGFVELLDEGRRLQSLRVRHGLRDCRLTAQGLRWNGKPLTLRGARWNSPPPPVLRWLPHEEQAVERRQQLSQELLRRRQRGTNLLIVPEEEGSNALWSAADEMGLLVLCRFGDAEFGQRLALDLAGHPACLGWLVPEETAGSAAVAEMVRRCETEGRKPLLGVERTEGLDRPLPTGAAFVVCPAALPAASNVPRIVPRDGKSEPEHPPPGILGWIDSPPE